jgi:DNA-binding CsgD family transcriptional regulator
MLRVLCAIVDTTPRPIDRLTRREREMLLALARDLTYAQIARELGCTERTVNTHLENVYRKLGVTNRVGAILVAVHAGLVER